MKIKIVKSLHGSTICTYGSTGEMHEVPVYKVMAQNISHPQEEELIHDNLDFDSRELDGYTYHKVGGEDVRQENLKEALLNTGGTILAVKK